MILEVSVINLLSLKHICIGCGKTFVAEQCHSCNQTDTQFCFRCHNQGNTFIHRYKQPIKEYLTLSIYLVSSFGVAISMGGLFI